MPGRCCYCLNDKGTMPVCMGCRTRAEMALAEREREKKNADFRKRGLGRKMRAVRVSAKRAK